MIECIAMQQLVYKPEPDLPETKGYPEASDASFPPFLLHRLALKFNIIQLH